METPPIVIAIADDHTLFRRGVASLMAEYDSLRVSFEAANGEQLQQMMSTHERPDVILMDIHMPVMDGYETTLWLKQNYPEIKVLALSMFDDDDAIIKMLKCGASGYLLKESKPSDLRDAIQIVYHKGIFLNEMVSGTMIRQLNTHSGANLSSKEIQFLQLCCSEHTYKEIADAMFVSPRTVDNYRESLFLKLGLRSRTGLVLYAIKRKIFLL